MEVLNRITDRVGAWCPHRQLPSGRGLGWCPGHGHSDRLT